MHRSTSPLCLLPACLSFCFLPISHSRPCLSLLRFLTFLLFSFDLVSHSHSKVSLILILSVSNSLSLILFPTCLSFSFSPVPHSYTHPPLMLLPICLLSLSSSPVSRSPSDSFLILHLNSLPHLSLLSVPPIFHNLHFPTVSLANFCIFPDSKPTRKN